MRHTQSQPENVKVSLPRFVEENEKKQLQMVCSTCKTRLTDIISLNFIISSEACLHFYNLEITVSIIFEIVI